MKKLESPEKDLPLRQDVHFLGELLGEVLQELGDTGLYQTVEAVRHAALAWRHGETHAENTLQKLLQDLPMAQTHDVVRAFSTYFTLVNLAERVHRIRRRRAYLQAGSDPQPGSLVAVLQALQQKGVEAQHMCSLLQQLQIVPVFTAHPTEITRRLLLTKEQRQARLLVERLSYNLLPFEQSKSKERLRQEISSAWQTDELTRGPSVADEVEHVLFYLTDVIYRIVPVFYEGLSAAFSQVYKAELPFLTAPLVQFGTWVGGDMDGNPNVGAASIRAALLRQRSLILKRYSQELQGLLEHLTQCRSRVAVSHEVDALIAKIQPNFADTIAVNADYQDMPYCQLVSLIHARLAATESDKIQGYASPQDLLQDLQVIRDSLWQNGGRHAGYFLVQRFMWRVQTFGFHLATLDIRQDSQVHRHVAGLCLEVAHFKELKPVERLQLLQKAWQAPVALPANILDDAQAMSTLEVLRTIVNCRTRFGKAAIGPYIISMAHGLDDILALLYLARCADLVDAQNLIDLDVAPLFETVPDLQQAGPCLQAMLADPNYRQHVSNRGNVQWVMLGYSDSNKESGLAASRWALYTAQVQLAQIAKQAGVQLILFHGRGGTASRGGSKPREAILAQPPGTMSGRLRLTEQGEMIHTKYGLRDIALRTMELMGGAMLQVMSRQASQTPDPSWQVAMQAIAQHSREVFRALVYDDNDFFEYFQAATPIDLIKRLHMGSRPASRRLQQGIADLRAIPWVFAWTQNRQMLPGWYGVGSALQQAIMQFGLPTLQHMARSWPFFTNLLADTEIALAKADMVIGARYAALAKGVGARLWPLIQAEFARTRTSILQIFATQALLQREPVLQRSIALRNPYVDPLSLLQIHLLARWRAGDRQDHQLEQILLNTVTGIARGLQNTG